MGNRRSPNRGVGQAQGGQGQEQVIFGDAQFHMLAIRMHGPALGRDDFFLAEHILAAVAVEYAAPVNPARPNWWTPSHPERW